MAVASRTPPLQHPMVDPKTGYITRPWVHWFQGMLPLADAVQYGLRAIQPPGAAVASGTLFGVIDEEIIERSNGTIWEPFGPHMVLLADTVQYGTRLLQPLATTVPVGTLYGVSDEQVIERSNGLIWEPFGSL